MKPSPPGPPTEKPFASAASFGSTKAGMRPWLLLCFSALLPLLLYAALGYGGQDFKYHAASWMELHDAWRAHEWRLGWAQWAQFGFGEPRFCFYPPLSLLVGAGLSFVLPWKLVPGAVVWLVLVLSGLSMYKAAGTFLDPRRRLQAALLYMFNPYLMMTVVIRFAIAEAWVQAFLPLLFVYFYLAVTGRRAWPVLLSGILLAAGWLTNLPEAIGLFYGFNVLAVVLAIRERSFKPLFAAAAAQALGLSIAAWRLLPALAEKGSVSSGNLLIYDFRSFMQLRHTPPPHLVVYASGVFILVSLVLVGFAVVQKGSGTGTRHNLTVALLSLAMFAVLFQLPATIPLWKILPQFRFILFPYRLLPLLSLPLILLLLAEGVSALVRKTGTLCLVLIALFPFLDYTRLLPFQRFHSIEAAQASWQTGFEGVEEYVPVGVPRQNARPATEARLAAGGAFEELGCRPILFAADPDRRVIGTESDASCSLTLNTFAYPFWRAGLDDREALVITPTAAGLLHTEIPPGKHKVTFEFQPATPLRTGSTLVSLGTFLASLAFLARTRRSWTLPAYSTPGYRDAPHPSRAEVL